MTALHALSLAVAVLLVPLEIRFFRDYTLRPPDERHPVSLAIVSTLLLLQFHALSIYAIDLYGWRFVRTVMLAVELVVIGHFVVAFRVGRARDRRRAPASNGH